MIYFMLNDLCNPTDKDFNASWKFGGLPLYFDGLMALAFTRAAEKKKTLASVSYGPDFLIISGLNIVLYVLSLSNTMICMRTPIYSLPYQRNHLCWQSTYPANPGALVNLHLSPAPIFLQERSDRALVLWSFFYTYDFSIHFQCIFWKYPNMRIFRID